MPAPGEAADAVLAAWLATDAGALLLRLRAELGFGDPAALRDAGDARSQAWLAGTLARHRQHDSVLSEEAVDDPARLTARRVWIIDPLDGTREFGERDRLDWAVHVALWQDGDLVQGAVALPAQGVTLATGTPLPRRPAPVGGPRFVASRTRAPALVGTLAEALGGSVVPVGSAGAKVAAVVRGDADAYVHAGGQYEWDSAAPVAVARAAGLHTSRLDGSPLVYNRPDPLLPDLLVCRPDLAGRILALIADR
ncbi:MULTISPECIES: 3'(2'),5'-bisphosphate nucleotidase CysQ [unclassified Frankia]|uniref:3'(2'),5'-bisphosphate nucleotidase CysQ n=2 Tax=Frankia TaxID=1854 RepID=UPI001EF4C13A|nr:MULTISPECIES: 3'(2'),5'-bisphosphate nucleotidase CysQ [unclassified Frankia]